MQTQSNEECWCVSVGGGRGWGVGVSVCEYVVCKYLSAWPVLFWCMSVCIRVSMRVCVVERESARKKESERNIYSVIFYLCCICACMFVQ